MAHVKDALAYTALGWSIVPAHSVHADGRCTCRNLKCVTVAKHPRVRWRAFQQRLPTEQEIVRWWKRYPDSNIALITGAVSGLVVVDVDPRHGGDESWSDYVRKHKTVQASVGPIALTGGGGAHHFYAAPPEPIHNRANVLPGIDSRGDGGYVIVPPSLHESGRHYEWDAAFGIETPLPTLPPTLARLLRSSPRAFGEATEAANARTLDIDGILDGRVDVPEGMRNDTIARVAGHFVGQGKSEREALLLTRGANNIGCKPPLSDEEVGTIVRSISERETRQQAISAVVTVQLETGAEHVDDMTHEEAREAADHLWRGLNVPVTTDWYVLRGEQTDYVLVTPENEIRLGSDLLNYAEVRRRLLNELSVLAPTRKEIPNWDQRALLLRRLAREEEVEPVRAGERVGEWLEEYTQRYHPQEVESDMRRDALRDGPILIGGDLHLRPPQLAQYLESNFGEQVKLTALRRLLRRAGWSDTIVRTGDTTMRAWRQQRKGKE